MPLFFSSPLTYSLLLLPSPLVPPHRLISTHTHSLSRFAFDAVYFFCSTLFKALLVLHSCWHLFGISRLAQDSHALIILALVYQDLVAALESLNGWGSSARAHMASSVSLGYTMDE